MTPSRRLFFEALLKKIQQQQKNIEFQCLPYARVLGGYLTFIKNVVKSANNIYVALSDPGSMKFSHIREQSSRDRETNMCQNVALIVFHTQNICHHAWRTLRTTL